MRILQINTYYSKGSTGKIVMNLLEAQKENSMVGYVLFGKGDVTEETNILKINNKFGYYIHKYKTHLFGNHAFYSKFQTLRALKLIEQIQPDIIHLHNLHGHYLNCEVLFNYLYKSGIPIVWTLHDCWAFTGHCAHFTSVNCNKWKTGCMKCELKNKYPRTICDRSRSAYIRKKKLFCNTSNINIVTVSNWLKGLVEESFFAGKNIITIYNWVDRKIFNEYKSDSLIKKRFNIEEKFVILGAATGWTESKGFNDFIKLSEKITEDEVIFIVGKAPRDKLPVNIINIDATSNAEELATIYQMADVFFNPSKEETFGMTTAEAMSCGTPAIVYDITACPEVVGENCNAGFAVELGNIDEVYNKIQKIRNNYETYQMNAIKYVEENFNKEKQLYKYINLYEDIIERDINK